jgi:hypothetical protein
MAGAGEINHNLHVFDTLTLHPRIKFRKYLVQFWNAGLHSSDVTTLRSKKSGS